MKRIADLQGEITALRKRIDEARVKADSGTDSVRHLENRFKELLVAEAERKAAQNEFIEKQSVAQLDRDRSYKEWRDSRADFQKQVEKLETQSVALEETLRSAKRAQETYNELNTKLERRINEVTEMQRLAEDRLRQEWVTFKADDQKRWTGYTLSQDEGGKDVLKSVQKLEERISALNESFQTTQDQLHQTIDATEQQLQELMNVAHGQVGAAQGSAGQVAAGQAGFSQVCAIQNGTQDDVIRVNEDIQPGISNLSPPQVGACQSGALGIDRIQDCVGQVGAACPRREQGRTSQVGALHVGAGND